MPIQQKRVRVSLDDNPNFRVTARTRENLGVQGVSSEQEVNARLLGIPGAAGTDGIDGIDGADGETTVILVTGYPGSSEETILAAVGVIAITDSSEVYIKDTAGAGLDKWLKLETNPEMNIELDELSNGNAYVGKSLPGTAHSDAAWSISYIAMVNQVDLSVTWANGTALKDKIWDNRGNYTYS